MSAPSCSRPTDCRNVVIGAPNAIAESVEEFELLPKPYEGMTDYSGMSLVLSRGLGNSVAPVRINDYPELVVINVT